MAQHPDQLTFSAASGGGRRTRRPQPPPVFSHPPVVLALQSFRPLPQNMIDVGFPAYQYQNNHQDFRPYEETYNYGLNFYYYGFGGSCDSYHWIQAPAFTPPTRSDSGYQHQTTNLETYDVAWMRRGGYVQEDESWILDGTGLEPEDTMIIGDGSLSEEVVSKYLKIKNCRETVAKDKDAEPKICVVCQDNMRQENRKIGVLECGHEYHACCIKKWLQRKNVCPLCKATALPVDGSPNQEIHRQL